MPKKKTTKEEVIKIYCPKCGEELEKTFGGTTTSDYWRCKDKKRCGYVVERPNGVIENFQSSYLHFLWR